MRLLLLALIALPCLHTACSKGDGPRSAQAPGGANQPQMRKNPGSTERARLVLDHDFGVVPHGESRTHEFALDLSLLEQPHVPLRVHLECSCGKAELVMRKPDGSERHIDGTGFQRNLPTDEEQAILRIQLDTRKKEARDIKSTISRGYIVLQPLDDDTGMARERWAFIVRFAIDAPVTLHPFSEFDFASVSQSMRGQIMTTMKGDENHADLEFLSVSTTDPSLTAKLEPDNGHTLIKASCMPGSLGNHRGLILVETNLPDYTIAIEAKWKVVPDLEATPINKISFRTPLGSPQGPGVEFRQSVLVIDHNKRRSPEFLVRSVVGDDGRDVSHCFEIKMTAVPTEERRQRLSVRYLGGLLPDNEPSDRPPSTFRGKILLAKHPKDIVENDDPILPIQLVVFPSKAP